MTRLPISSPENQILSQATQIWGSQHEATAWLNQPHPELQDQTPNALLGTEACIDRVENLLAALDFGFPI